MGSRMDSFPQTDESATDVVPRLSRGRVRDVRDSVHVTDPAEGDDVASAARWAREMARGALAEALR